MICWPSAVTEIQASSRAFTFTSNRPLAVAAAACSAGPEAVIVTSGLGELTGVATTDTPGWAGVGVALARIGSFACGLGTVSLLDGDVTSPSLTPENGELPVRAVAPDPALVHADDAVREWWLARMEASRRAGA